MTPRRLPLLRPLLLAACAALLAACAGTPVPDWQVNAHDAAERASAAYLRGDDRVAAQEWRRARAELARTGQPALLARLELMACAAQTASLAGAGCPAFEALRADALPAEQAYADYLAGRATPAQAALLPPGQRGAAANVAAIAGMADPLARLVAAGAALQAGRATPELLALASDTASAQGWRRPLLAWLLLRVQRAEQIGDAALAERLRRRVALVESAGRPITPPAAPAQPPNN
jgi:hypothetical protein